MASHEQRARQEAELRLARKVSLEHQPATRELVGGMVASPTVRDSEIVGPAVEAMRADAARRSRTSGHPMRRARAAQVLAEQKAARPSPGASANPQGRAAAKPAARSEPVDYLEPGVVLSGEAAEIERERLEEDRVAAEFEAEREAARGEMSPEESAALAADPWGHDFDAWAGE